MERQRLRNGFNPRSEHRMRWLSGTLRSQATPCRCVLGGHLGCTRQRVQPRGVEEQRPGTVAPTKAHVQSEGQKKRGLLWPFHPEPPLRVHNVSLPSACCIRRPFPQHGHTHLERQGLSGLGAELSEFTGLLAENFSSSRTTTRRDLLRYNTYTQNHTRPRCMRRRCRKRAQTPTVLLRVQLPHSARDPDNYHRRQQAQKRVVHCERPLAPHDSTVQRGTSGFVGRENKIINHFFVADAIGMH